MTMNKKKSKAKTQPLTSIVSGQSLNEIGKLQQVIDFANKSLIEHRNIIKTKRNIELRTKDSVDVTSREIAELTIDGYSRSDIKEINVTKCGNESVLFIRRTITK